jgi:hypothetical protein
MARIRIASTSGASENTIVFSPAGGHSHNGRNSSLIDSTAYSMYDFSPTFVGTEVNPDRAVRQENNRIAFEDVIKRVVNNSVLAPAGIRLDPGSLNGSLIIANTITANQLAANTITASEISAGTITANELSSNIVLINNRITSQNWNGTIQANGTIYSNGIGSSGWAITNTHAVFDSTLIRGAIAADSLLTPGLSISNTGAISSTSFNVTAAGNVTATNANITGSITSGSGTIGGWTIDTNRIYGGSTYLYSNGQITSGNFNVTSGGVLSATGASITGTLTSSAGTIGGWTINPASISAGNTALYSNGQITNGNFSVSSGGVLSATGASISGAVTATSGTFTGTINAAGGTFNGYVTAGGSSFGRLDNINGYYHGININGTFQSCFIRGNAGEVYFRADNGTQWIKFENGSVQISTPGFSVNGSSASFAGSISASTISGTTISGSTLSTNDGTNGLLITSDGYLRGTGGNGVRIQNSDGTTGSTKFFKNSITTDDISTNLISITPNGTDEVNINPSGIETDVEISTGGIRVGNGKTISATTAFYTSGSGTSARMQTVGSVQYLTGGSSSRHLKENIKDLEDSIGILKTLKPKVYNFRVDAFQDNDPITGKPWTEEARQLANFDIKYGLILEDVLEVRPELISYIHEKTETPYDQEGGYADISSWKPQMWEEADVLVLCVKAIQELSAKNEELESRIQTLEGV